MVEMWMAIVLQKQAARAGRSILFEFAHFLVGQLRDKIC